MPGAQITKRMFASAMKDMMSRIPFAKISVGDICEVCQLNRKSFYYHFKDKYDLVTWIFQSEFIDASQEREYENGWDFIENMCVYFYKNRLFYINALKVEGQNSFADFFQNTLSPVVKSYVKQALPDNEYSDLFANVFVEVFISAVNHWLEEMPELQPEQFVRMGKMSLIGVARKLVDDHPPSNDIG